MPSTKAKLAAALCGAALCAIASAVAAADVAPKLRAYQESTAQATQILSSITDEGSAKLHAAQLDAVMKRQRADEGALHAELNKLNLGKQADGQQMEQATAAIAKSNEALAAQEMRVLSNPAAGAVVGRSLQAPASRTK